MNTVAQLEAENSRLRRALAKREALLSSEFDLFMPHTGNRAPHAVASGASPVHRAASSTLVLTTARSARPRWGAAGESDRVQGACARASKPPCSIGSGQRSLGFPEGPLNEGGAPKVVRSWIAWIGDDATRVR
jgi:hypothetical protein